MKKLKTLLAVLAISLPAFSQMFSGQGGMPVTYMVNGEIKFAGDIYNEVEGNPYFYKDWAKGSVKLADGKTYQNILLMYDEVARLLMFKYNLSDTVRKFALRPLEFKLTYYEDNKVNKAHFVSGYDATENTDTTTFFQILSYGSTQLLKRAEKNIIKFQQFNMPGVFERVEEHKLYYLTIHGKPVKVNNDAKAVLNVLADSAGKLQKYIADNKLDFKRELDFVNFIDYYNSL